MKRASMRVNPVSGNGMTEIMLGKLNGKEKTDHDDKDKLEIT